ncbi:MAG: helix-turn-helix transcriptional regulator [Saprospiraceae bacterium]|nr:helix-turn-helix transcriptional regulator [Saprospiraceae bacterium]
MDQQQIDQSIRLKKLIKMLGLNQTLFAQSLGMTQPNISRMVSGDGKISLEVLNRITDIYKNINLHWLLTGEGTMFTHVIPTEPMREVNEIPVYKGKGRLEDLEERIERLEKIVGRLTKDDGKD